MANKRKFKKSFCKELHFGTRKDGTSIEELCARWGVSRTSYYNWVDQYPDFREAHEVGETDFAAYWMKLNRQVSNGSIKGNAGTIKFSMANLFGWKDRAETKVEHEEQVQTITINVLPSRSSTTIEHKPVEAELVSNNILEFKSDPES